MPRRMDSRLTRAEYRDLHVWPRQLGLDDAVRLDVQRGITGHESCKDMTYADYLALARHYSQLLAGQRAGRQARPKTAGQKASETLRRLYAKIQSRGPKEDKASVAQLEKIIRMLDLERGAEEERLNQALQAFVGCPRWQWLTPKQGYDMIEALKARAARARRDDGQDQRRSA